MKCAEHVENKCVISTFRSIKSVKVLRNPLNTWIITIWFIAEQLELSSCGISTSWSIESSLFGQSAEHFEQLHDKHEMAGREFKSMSIYFDTQSKYIQVVLASPWIKHTFRKIKSYLKLYNLGNIQETSFIFTEKMSRFNYLKIKSKPRTSKSISREN